MWGWGLGLLLYSALPYSLETGSHIEAGDALRASNPAAPVSVSMKLGLTNLVQLGQAFHVGAESHA